MATEKSSASAHPSTREQRGLELYRRGGIERINRDAFIVPSRSRQRAEYFVDLERQSCECLDHEIRQENCKHILAVGIYHAKHRQRPHACYQGVVFIGHVVEDPGTGEEVEVIEAVPCRRCADSR